MAPTGGSRQCGKDACNWSRSGRSGDAAGTAVPDL